MTISKLALGGALVSLLITGCAPSPDGYDTQEGGAAARCSPGADDDGDCLDNEIEGCALDPPPDRDDDGNPDFADADADGDGIPDRVEAGRCDAPIDSDGDRVPDYQDRDSDGDGAADQFEDRNGDGVLGTCSARCQSPADCATGESCSQNGGAGVCVSVACLAGETDPRSLDTDGDGVPDRQEGTFVCNPRTEDNPEGLKHVKLVDSIDIPEFHAANWRIAIESHAQQGMPALRSAAPGESGYMIDLPREAEAVAGFLVSRASTVASASAASTAAIGAIQALSPVTGVTVRVSGNVGRSLDGFDTVRATTLIVDTARAIDATDLRALLYAALLARAPAEVFVPDPGWRSGPDTRFAIVFQTVLRADDRQLLYMGAVARAADFDDRTKATGFRVDDLANGSGLAESQNPEAIACEQFMADQRAAADIVWVVDGSGSMSDDRARVAGTAQAFFAKALGAGLDFRMGVTDMTLARAGVFATRQAGATGDRWLKPDELDAFRDAINAPSGPDTSDVAREHGLHQGRATVERHLPRDDADPARVREHANLVVIYMSDEKPDEIEIGAPGPSGTEIIDEGNEQPTAAQALEILAHMMMWIADFVRHRAVAHAIVVPLPFSDPPCSAGGGETGYGYFDLVNATRGQIGSICQTDLGPTLDAIIDNILGDASPIVLSAIPISATIAVSRNAVPIPRSRSTGFDYRAASNSIVFLNLPHDPDAEIVVSYRRWADQAPIE